jgi:maltokinase
VRAPPSNAVCDPRTYEKRRRSVKPDVRGLTPLERAVERLDLEELAGRRWFAGKARRPVAIELVDAFPIHGIADAWLAVADVAHDDASRDRYLLPALVREGELAEPPPDHPYWPTLAELVARGDELAGAAGRAVATPSRAPVTPRGGGRRLTDDQSNTSVVLGERIVVKCYRRILPGAHPEPELLDALSRIGSRRAPGFLGSLARRSSDGEETLLCLYAFVPGDPVGWEPIVERVRRALADDDPEALDAEVEEASTFGLAAGELHVALARALGVERAGREDAARAVEAAHARLDEALRVASGELARAVASVAPALGPALEELALLAGAPLARVHGDLHVGQLVATPHGPVAVDFEGEPGLALDARRRRTSPLRDLACLLLSLDHVAVAAARRLPTGDAAERALAWSARARTAATASYRAAVVGSPLRFDERLLRAFQLEKELHEVIYAATVLPEWSYAPALVLPRLVDPPSRATR